MSQGRRRYPSDLTDLQWELIRHLIPIARTGGRPRSTNIRKVVNAIFYIIRTGCAWRYLPKEFPCWQTVYTYYSYWNKTGVIKNIHELLAKEVRKNTGRDEAPSVLIADSQSVKAQFGEARGFDGFKKVRGRKRNIFVDTLGLIHSVKVDSANIKDHQSASEMLNPETKYFPKTVKNSLTAFYADGGYKAHDFQNLVFKYFRIFPTLKISTHNKNQKQSRILISSNLKPKRWIVERTFSWFNHYRRLNRDYEKKTLHSEGMILMAMSQLMLNRLIKPPTAYVRWT